MKRHKLNAVVRAERGSGAGRKLRAQKQIPAVMYGRDKDSVLLSVSESEITHLINYGSANALIDLSLGNESQTVMIKDIQRHRIKDEVVHLDFYIVDLKEEITTNVTINLVGEAEGVKAGGVMQYQTREIEVKCLPTEIPEKLDLDISALNIGESLTVADIEMPQGLEVLTPETEVIVSVLAPRLAEDAETDTEETEEAPEREPETE